MTDFTSGKLTPRGFNTKTLEDGTIAVYQSTANVIYLGFYSVAGKHIGGHRF